MDFTFRYWKTLVKGSFTLLLNKPLNMILPIVAWIFVFCGFRHFTPLRILLGIAAAIIFMLLWVLISSAIITAKNSRYMKVLNDKGYSKEYLDAFQREKIIGKPFNAMNSVMYAEIFMRMGSPEEAIKYLNAVKVPSDQINTKICYFYIYAISALKIGRLDIAEDEWRRSGDFAAKRQNSFGYDTSAQLLYLAMATIDCYAGRYQRAYEQTTAFLGSKYARKSYSPSGIISLRILLMYELKMLGKMEEFKSLEAELEHELADFKPFLDCDKKYLAEDFEKARNGILPL